MTANRASTRPTEVDFLSIGSIPERTIQPTASIEAERLPVIIVSNDVIPGMGMAVAAPGLRSHGLAEGLVAAGFSVTQTVAQGPTETKWSGTIPPPRLPGVEITRAEYLGDYLRTRAPAIVIAINSNQIDKIPPDENLHLIVDLFAPRILEVACRAENYPVEQIREMRARNLEAFSRAEGFIVNGAKKIPFYLGWLMQIDRDPRTVPLDVVPMTMTRCFDDDTIENPARQDASRETPSRQNQTIDKPVRGSRPIQAVTAGYLQGWSKPGSWFSTVADLVGAADGTFNVLLVPRRGVDDGGGEIDDVFDHHAVQAHKEMLFPDFQRFMSQMDVAIDLFSNSIERQYAMITRTVGAIACGLPVIHPPWSETSPYIEKYDAGWLVDPDDRIRVSATLAEALNDRDMLAEKAANARRLWTEVFRPEIAVAPLVNQINEIARRRTQGQS